MVIGKIQIDAAFVRRGADMDVPLRPIELSSGFEEIKKQSDGPGTGNAAGFLIVLAPQPGPKAGAPDGPGFPVPVDHEICKGRAAGRVEELCFDIQIGDFNSSHSQTFDGTEPFLKATPKPQKTRPFPWTTPDNVLHI
jgi:hypothetical protein